jgi:hypothetical protein
MSIRCRLQIEELGQRILPSATPGLLPLPAFTSVLAAPHAHALAGQGSGTYIGGSMVVDAGESAMLNGSAYLARLGHVTVTGTVAGLGFIVSGHAWGTLTFANARGSVTVALEGPLQSGFSPLPEQFSYTVVSGTGAYQHLHDHGSLKLVLHPFPIDPLPGSLFPVAHGTFTLTIAGGHKVPPPKVTSGIDGVAMIGPTSPVARPGVPDTRPLPGAILSIRPAKGGAELARVTAGHDGKFTIKLPPGRYRIVALAPQPGAPYPRGEVLIVVVHPGHYTHVTVNYDSGIR